MSRNTTARRISFAVALLAVLGAYGLCVAILAPALGDAGVSPAANAILLVALALGFEPLRRLLAKRLRRTPRGEAGQAEAPASDERGVPREPNGDLRLRRERLEAVDEFAGAVAHGIRNPLAAIRAGAQVAQRSARDDAVVTSLNGVLSEVDRLEQRVRVLLDFARPLEPDLEPVDVTRVLQSAAGALADRAGRTGVELSLDFGSAAPWALADRSYLQEALLELGANALRAMPDGGALRFTLSERSGALRLRISDDGVGIPDAVRARIFQLFFRTEEGTGGLGLPRAKKLVEAQGGELRLEESDPTGTTFEISLRPAPAPSAPSGSAGCPD